MSVVVVDSNIAILLIVGAANRSFIASHKRLGMFEAGDIDLIEDLVSTYEAIVVSPNVLTEAFSLATFRVGTALPQIRRSFANFTAGVVEVHVPSVTAVSMREFSYLGLTDSVLLQLCLNRAGLAPVLLTMDEPLANQCRTLGLPALNYPEAKRNGVMEPI